MNLGTIPFVSEGNDRNALESAGCIKIIDPRTPTSYTSTAAISRIYARATYEVYVVPNWGEIDPLWVSVLGLGRPERLTSGRNQGERPVLGGDVHLCAPRQESAWTRRLDRIVGGQDMEALIAFVQCSVMLTPVYNTHSRY